MKRIFVYLKKEIIGIIFSLLFAMASVGLSLYFAVLIGQAIDLIIENSVDFLLLKPLLFKMLILVFVIGISQTLISFINNYICFKVTKKLRNDAFIHLQKLPLNYFDQNTSGDIISRLIADVEQFSDGLLLGFTQLFTGIATIFGTLLCLFLINYLIALCVLVITPLSLFVAKFISSKTYNLFKKQSEIKGEQTALVEEMLSNLKVVKAYDQEENVINHFDEVNKRLQDCSLKAIFFSSLTNPCTRFVNAVVYAVVALVGAILVIKQNPHLLLTVGELTTCLSYANQYTKPFNEISMVITEFQNALACAKRVFAVIDEKVEVEDANNAIILDNCVGHVQINNVYFSYVPSQKLITDFNLDVKPGMKIAIVGPTGCGKTTLINLLMRFYDVNKGCIMVDGYDIREIKRSSLRGNYGMVLQDTWIKTGTVMENIIMGKPNATRDEVITAAKKTYAHGFIKRLPNGYDTIIQNDGNLSIGEKQLLCITRVMLSNPQMLILDEATSSIDTITEQKIQNAFNVLMENKTAFIVAHRLSTIQAADLIMVMNNGNVIEQGNHQELLEKGGFYASLYNSQFVK